MASFCTQCGAALSSAERFCPACGAALAPTAPDTRSGEQAAAAAESLSWQIDVPVMGNRFLRGNILMGAIISALITGLIIGGILGISGDLRSGVLGFCIGAGITIALFLCGLLGYFVIVGFSQPMIYHLDKRGIKTENASRNAKRVHWAAIILGILARKPAVAGAGLLAKTSEKRFCAWEDVRKIEDFSAERTLRLRGDMLTTVLVFCLPNNYTAARDFIFSHAPQAARA